jgi:UDP-N-acetylmuramate dehydrogenase
VEKVGQVMNPAQRPEASTKEVMRFLEAAEALGVDVVANEPLARHCTFRIGGPADLFAVADDIRTLERLGELAMDHSLPLTILGGGSNVLVSDSGVRGLVVANQTRGMGLHATTAPRSFEQEGPNLGVDRPIPQLATGNRYLVADSGVALAGLARWTIREGWSGLEWAVSIPGTVGGAIIGNAGAHGGQIADNLAFVLVARPGVGRQTMMAEDMEFSYRDSVLRRNLVAGQAPPVVLQAVFRMVPGDVAQMTAEADACLAKRRASQPVEPSAGSVFRNPPGDYAGRLVEVAGLKGHRIGGAQVSPRHANFIVNTGSARASEVAELIGLIRQRVSESTGIGLVPEILCLGDWTESK